MQQCDIQFLIGLVVWENEWIGLHQTFLAEPRGAMVSFRATRRLRGLREFGRFWVELFHGQQPMNN